MEVKFSYKDIVKLFNYAKSSRIFHVFREKYLTFILRMLKLTEEIYLTFIVHILKDLDYHLKRQFRKYYLR